MSLQEAETIVTNLKILLPMENEAELLNTFLDPIEDADVLSGWNSEGYDISSVTPNSSVLSKSSFLSFAYGIES